MANDISHKFIKLNSKEQASKFQQLLRNRSPFYIWQKNQPAISLEIDNVIFTDNKILVLFRKNTPLPSTLLGQTLNSFFQVSNMKFFSKGRAVINEQKNIFFEILDASYKYEKRVSDRIITFPHRSAYIILQIVKESDDNVVSIAKKKFSENIKHQGNVISQITNKLDDTFSTTKQFRCLDISSVGISIMANRIERDFLERNSTIRNLSLRFENETFVIDSANVIYIVDYVDPRAASIKMFKIGLETKWQDSRPIEFFKKITEEDAFERTQLENEFSTFIS